MTPVAGPRRPAARSGESLTASGQMLSLQRSAGNQATLALLRRGQPKLEVGAVDDPCEVEADRVSRDVVSALAGGSGGSGTVINRRPATGRTDGPAGDHAEAAITAARGGGRPLDPGLRGSMESAFGGADFSSVRLHSGARAQSLNDQLSARAFTIGGDIFFRDGLPDRSQGGHALLAHELTHTIQQGASGGPAPTE